MKNINGINIPDYDFTGKVAIVTGGSSGIGRAAALQLAANGATVVIGSIPYADCVSVCREIEAIGGRALAVEVNVAEEQQVQTLIDRTVESFGRLDIMLCNAGIGGQVLPILEQSAEEFDRVIRVNLKGVFLCAKAAAREMIQEGHGGRIICTGSIAYIEGGGMHGPYGAAKGGVSTLVRSMGAEWAKHGITVNAVAPGLTRTPINAEVSTMPELLSDLLSRIPLRRMADPSEIAAVMTFLASEAASFITGTTIIADGGATIGGISPND